MDHDDGGGRTTRFAAYLGDLASVLGDGRRVGPLTSYCTGLLLPAERKSVEPMAALTAPDSIATLRRELVEGLVATLLRCPCCSQQSATTSSQRSDS